MSFVHRIDNDSSLFDFDSHEPLSDLEDSAPEDRRPFICSSSHPTTALPHCYCRRDGHVTDDLRIAMETKGKSITLVGGTEPVSIPVAVDVEPEIDVFSLSFQAAGPSSQPRYDHLHSFDFDVAGAISYLDPDGIVEVPVGGGDVDGSDIDKGKGRELPPTLPPLSFSPESFSYGSVDWPSLAGPSSYGSGYTSMEGVEPDLDSSSPLVEVPVNTPVSPDMTGPMTPDEPRRRTVSNISKGSRRSLSVPSIPRMKVKFASNKTPGTLARKLLFKKSPTSSPHPPPADVHESSVDAAILSDLGYIPPGNCLTPWSRSPPAIPIVETSSVWGVVASQPINIGNASSLPLRTKGRSYSSPFPLSLPAPSIFDIVPLGPIDIFEPLPLVLPAYFDECLPRELKLHVFTALLDLHAAEFEKRLKDGKWTALKASSSRHKWAGRDRGFRELFKLSRVSRSWRDLAFDGQLWSKLDLRAFPKVPPNVLLQLSRLAGGFIKHVDLSGHAALSASTLIDISHNLSVQAALLGGLSNTTHNQLTSLNLHNCPSLTTRSLHHILIRSPWLQRLCLKGQPAVTNTTCEVLANYCPRLVYLDLSRCPKMTGEGIRSAASCAVARGEHVQLRQLRLSGIKKVTDETMLALGKAAPFLEVLDLSYARDLHNSAIEAFVSCTEEAARIIDAVQLTAREAGRDPADPERYWRRVTRLRHLNLSACLLLTDHACSHLAHAVPKLEFLELAGIGSELNDDGLVRLLNTTRYIRRLDLEDATAVSDNVLVALTPQNTTLPPSRTPRNALPEPGHALEHLIISHANVESEALSELIRACTKLRVLEADNTHLTGVTMKEFVQTARKRKIADAKIIAVDCRSVGEFAVKEMTAHSRPRMGWRSWHARKLSYLDAKDEEGLNVGQDECDSNRVVVKTFYSWQTVDAVQAAREKKRKSSSRRRGSGTADSACSEERGTSTPGRARWWSPGSRRSTGPSTPTLLDLNTDRGEGCTIM